MIGVADSNLNRTFQIPFFSFLNSYNFREEVHTVRGDSGGKGNKARTKAAADGIADWLNQQSNETLFALLLLIIFFYFLGMLNSSSRKGHDD